MSSGDSTVFKVHMRINIKVWLLTAVQGTHVKRCKKRNKEKYKKISPVVSRFQLINRIQKIIISSLLSTTRLHFGSRLHTAIVTTIWFRTDVSESDRLAMEGGECGANAIIGRQGVATL